MTAAPVSPSSMAGSGNSALSPAAQAFDAVAERFDERFGGWLSVQAQRRSVRTALVEAFPPGARLVEIGGGTGEDACWLIDRGREVLLTDPSPRMVRIAAGKLRTRGAPAPVAVAAESLGALATVRAGERLFDGAYSNFAALNCVPDLGDVGRGLAQLVRPGGRVLLVMFGIAVPGEWAVELAHGRPRAAVRRFARGDVRARLGGREFSVRYHRRADVERAFAPWFRLTERRGIGVFVPPSAAEPWISSHPRLLRALERLDRRLACGLAALGDHVLYVLERTGTSAPTRAER